MIGSWRALEPVVRIATGVAAFLAAATATAHETWLIPARFDAAPSEVVSFDLTSGMDFPERGTPAPADRIAQAVYRLGGTNGRLTLSQSFATSGIATVWVDLKPREIELNDAEVAEYLDEIGASDATRALWARRKGRVPWKETYTKHAKTFVAVGFVDGDRSWAEPAGDGFELVPLDNPLSARAGGRLAVRVLDRGEPLANAPVGLMVEGSKERIFRTTDPKGEATFPLPRAGAALLFAVDLRPSADGARWTSEFTTATFRILPEK